jgi:hypothetical protein
MGKKGRRLLGRGVVVTSLIVCSVLVSGCVVLRPLATRLFGEARVIASELPDGSVTVPHVPRDRGYQYGGVPLVPETGVVRDIVEEWASRDVPNWEDAGKVNGPRVVLAKLTLGRDVGEANAYLRASEPWAGIGSTYGLRPSGDYDFSLPPLTAILYLFGNDPEILFPATRDHLLDVLLNQDGNKFRVTVPGSLGLVGETENHILMTEGSRYLKNQWLRLHGEDNPLYDNVANGMQERLVVFIHEMERAGPYEFNSNPYAGYTLMALLTLEAFADPPVAGAARDLIDRINYEYVLSSLDLRRYGPYRRQTRRAGITDLTDHAHTSMMRVWVNLGSDHEYRVANNTHQALYAALMPYRLPDEQLSAVISTEDSYYVRIGRGPDASAEIYSGGDGYLISAGGTGRRGRTQIVARPITIMLADGALDATELFAIGAEGSYEDWNNTGVLPGLAVGRSPVVVPDGRRPVASGGIWRVFLDESTNVLIAAGSSAGWDASGSGETGGVGVLYLLDSADQAQLGMDPDGISAWLAANCGAPVLNEGRVVLPDGRSASFDLESGPDMWVIQDANGQPSMRDLTSWPRLDGWTTPPGGE